MDRPPFLKVPIEIRNLIYKELLSINIRKTQKPFPDTCRSVVRHNWNLETAILSVNRQIHDEAKHVLGTENNFIVIECAAKELEQSRKNMGKEDPGIMQYNVRIWPQTRREALNVPNERMRIRFSKGGRGVKQKDNTWYCVITEEELRDVMIGLSFFQNKNNEYRTSGLSSIITLGQHVSNESESSRKARESKMLEPLLNLRHLKSIKVENGLESSSKHLSDHACRTHWDSDTTYATFEYMMQAAEEARVKGHHNAATGYLNRAHDYVLHFITKEKQIVKNNADPLAFTFKINLERSRNWLEQGNYEDALGACEIALEIANELFLTHPAPRPPPVDDQ
ncbi:MAG: hypothetical protein Q9174_006255, partial [Haloplaca sp. 1 TL-2023]